MIIEQVWIIRSVRTRPSVILITIICLESGGQLGHEAIDVLTNSLVKMTLSI